MADRATYRGAYPQLVAKIIAGYLAHHKLSPEQVPKLIDAVRRSFSALGTLAAPPAPPRVPAVQPRRSVRRDAVICLECGWSGKMLRRHLGSRHGLSAEQYLRRWNLPSDHKLTAPSYSARRSTLAKDLGLGRRPPPAARRKTPRSQRSRPRLGARATP